KLFNKILMGYRLAIFNDIQQRVPYKMHGEIMLALIKSFFKRQNYKKFIHIPFNGFNPSLFPCPNLRGDIIKCFKSFLLCPLSNPKVKSRIIHEEHHIGLICGNIFLTKGNVFKDRSDIQYNFQKTHKGQLSIMFDELPSLRFHQVSSPKSKISL